jgi:uncharacterized membrane protein
LVLLVMTGIVGAADRACLVLLVMTGIVWATDGACLVLLAMTGIVGAMGVVTSLILLKVEVALVRKCDSIDMGGL